MTPTHTLKQDVLSKFRQGKDLPILARKNDPVMVVALHDHVAIVENKKGDRLSVHVTLIEQIKIENEN